jgi:hypothetical protein
MDILGAWTESTSLFDTIGGDVLTNLTGCNIDLRKQRVEYVEVGQKGT